MDATLALARSVYEHCEQPSIPESAGARERGRRQCVYVNLHPRHRPKRSLLDAIHRQGVPMTTPLVLPTLGITEIDKQHRQLLNSIEHLEAWVGKGYGLAAACAAILSLQDYISSHFHYEESFLRSHAYSKLEEHIEEHRKIRAQVAIYTQQITDGGDVSSQLCLLLREWLITHIGIDDVEYAEVLKSST